MQAAPRSPHRPRPGRRRSAAAPVPGGNGGAARPRRGRRLTDRLREAVRRLRPKATA